MGGNRPAFARLTARLRSAARAATGFGWGLTAVAVACLTVGTWLNWQEFTQLGVVGMSLVLLALLWVLVPGTPATELSLRPARITEGRPVEAQLDVRTGSVPLLHPVLEIPVSGSRGVAVRLPILGPFARHHESVPLPARPRGVWTVGPVRYEKSDVLGLARRRVETSSAGQLWVRPRVVPLEALTSGATIDLEGVTSEQLTMSDLAFHALREYRPGDDLRHVHWRSSAKADRLLVRQYHETRRGHVTVIVDHEPRSFPRPADFELAVSIASSVALRAVGDGLDVHLACGSVWVAARGPEEVLDTACRFRRSSEDYVGVAMTAAAANPGTGLVLQVSGPGRPTGVLRAAALRFNAEAPQLVIRADTGGQAGVTGSQRSREIRVVTLEQLPGLLVGSLR
jgi:uncharacterized protein (DUF58 family)